MVWSIFQPFFSAFSASFTKKTVHMVVVIGPDGRNPRNPKNRAGMGVNLPTIPMRNPSGSSYKPQHTINSQFPFLLVKTCHNHIYLVKSHKHIKTNYKHIFYIILQYIITNRTSGTFLYTSRFWVVECRGPSGWRRTPGGRSRSPVATSPRRRR